jgi:putative redox protein
MAEVALEIEGTGGAPLVVHGRSEIAVDQIEGPRFSISIREHGLVVDQPRSAGGEDMGATPTELMVASLAACVAHYARNFLHEHGLQENVSARASWWVDLRAERLARIDIRLEAGHVPAEETEAFRHAVEHCLVENSLREPPAVTIDIDIKEG